MEGIHRPDRPRLLVHRHGYNGESFFVPEPMSRTAAWSAIYSTVSRPFPKPKTKGRSLGSVAIKVINHYGNEVLKAYPIT